MKKETNLHVINCLFIDIPLLIVDIEINIDTAYLNLTVLPFDLEFK